METSDSRGTGNRHASVLGFEATSTAPDAFIASRPGCDRGRDRNKLADISCIKILS